MGSALQKAKPTANNTQLQLGSRTDSARASGSSLGYSCCFEPRVASAPPRSWAAVLTFSPLPPSHPCTCTCNGGAKTTASVLGRLTWGTAKAAGYYISELRAGASRNANLRT